MSLISLRTCCILFSTILFLSNAYPQSHWKELDSPVTTELKCGFFIDEQHAIAVGENGTIIHSTDAGETWTGQQDEEQGWFWTAGFKQGGNFAIAGGDNGLLMSSTDYGESWSEIATGLPIGSFIFGCQVVDENTFYLAGGEAPTTGVVMKTTDAGKHWKTMPIPDMYFLDRIVFLTDMLGFTCGSTETASGKILKTTDGGTTWVPIFETDTGFVTSVQCPTEQFIYATITLLNGNGGLLIRSSDGGTTWNEQYVPDHEMISNFFLDAGQGYACGPGIILHTSDGGVNWINTGYTGLQNINYVHAFGTSAFAVGLGGTLLKYTLDASVDVESPIPTIVYPNPAKNGVRILVPVLESGQRLMIYDVLGKKVYSEMVGTQEIFFERGSLPNGVYYYFISSAEGKLDRGSFVFE
jgi:photosystem II stability/assembly factor-like uncharacterized protein